MGALPLPDGTNAPDTVRDLRIIDAGVFGTLNVGGILILPVKTTTGDPLDPAEGQVYVNTFDSKIRCYADGQWRDLAVW